MLNKKLLEEGYAKLATYPPNVKYVDEFKAIQKEARKENRDFGQKMFLNKNTEKSKEKKFSLLLFFKYIKHIEE